MRVIVSAQTGAEPSRGYHVKEGRTASVKLSGVWAAGEFANVQYYPAFNTPENYYYEGVQKQLHTENPHILIHGPFDFRINKLATAGLGGIELVGENSGVVELPSAE